MAAVRTGLKESCILCGGAGPFVRLADRLRDSREHGVVRCSVCGHCQLSPLPGIEEDRAFYDADLQTKNLDRGLDFETIRRKKGHDTDRRVRFLKEQGFTPGAELLDVGSGYGVFLAEAFRQGYKATGVEISSERRKLCATLTEAPVLDVDLLEDGHRLGRYDVITLFHVVEHLTRPRPLLERLADFLQPDGALVVEVPNLEDRLAGFCPPYRDFLWQRAHVSYFTARGLRRLLEDAGYQRVEVHGLQRYGIANAWHWLRHGTPQVRDPSFEQGEGKRWVRRAEQQYKRWLERGLRSDTLMAVARR